MRIKQILSIGFLLLMHYPFVILQASDRKSPIAHQDTVIRIPEILVTASSYSPNSSAGLRQTTLSGSVIESNITQSLSELISDNSLIYIKSMGTGAMATSSFRGTSSNHTQVNWNGIPINSPMLGNFDFSQTPAFFTDQVALIHGSGAQESGSGALGGSIHLNNTRLLNQPISGRLLSEYGSNSTITEAISIGRGSESFGFRTRLYYQHSKNDFLYLNKVLGKDAFYERRKNSEFTHWGAMQELQWKLWEKSELSAHLWYMEGERSLPQPIIVSVGQIEHQHTRNIRLLSKLKCDINDFTTEHTISYLNDRMEYQKEWQSNFPSTESDNRSNTLLIKSEAERTWGQFHLRTLLQYRLDAIQSDNYSDRQVDRNSGLVSIGGDYDLRHTLLSARFNLEANEQLVMPSGTIGFKTIVLPDRITLGGNIASNYRYPTLNDLYWTPGGNPDLRPEQGVSGDLTLSLTPTLGTVRFKIDVTYFDMLINNWIAWFPADRGYIWSPQNLRKVRSSGVEFYSEMTAKSGVLYHKFSLNYGYTSSLNYDSNRESSTYRRQLPYVPRHKGTIRYQLNVYGIKLAYSASYTDQRYTTSDESYSTPAYLIHDAEVSYTWEVTRKIDLEFKLRANNLLDTYYENTQYYPMPLRSFLGSVSVHF